MCDTTNSDDVTDAAIVSAAEQLAEAEVRVEQATSALHAAEAARDDVHGRIQTLEGRRREIGARRAGGDRRDDDGAELALLHADAEALGVILTEHDVTAAATRGEAERATRVLDMAKYNFARTEDEALERQLVTYLEQVAPAMAQALAALRAAPDRLGGGRLSWAPPRDLMNRLTMADLGRQW